MIFCRLRSCCAWKTILIIASAWFSGRIRLRFINFYRSLLQYSSSRQYWWLAGSEAWPQNFVTQRDSTFQSRSSSRWQSFRQRSFYASLQSDRSVILMAYSLPSCSSLPRYTLPQPPLPKSVPVRSTHFVPPSFIWKTIFFVKTFCCD